MCNAILWCHAVTLSHLSVLYSCNTCVLLNHLATQPSLHILSINKSMLRFLNVKLIFWTWNDTICYKECNGSNKFMASLQSPLKIVILCILKTASKHKPIYILLPAYSVLQKH